MFPMEKQHRRRLIAIMIIVSVLLGGLAVRVYSIQVIQGPIYAAMAQSQQRIALSGVDSRGEICDRNGEPLTGAKLEYVYVLRRDRVEGSNGRLNGSAERLMKELGARERRTSNKKYRIFTSVGCDQESATTLRKDYGAYIMQIPQRYQEEQTAIYLLGYVRDSDGVGMAGLEKAFDTVLSQRDKVIYGVADAANRILPGYGIQNEEERSVRLITTLDRELQERLEDIACSSNEGRASIIVTDVASGDILAAATAPGFDPLTVEELTESGDEELLDIGLRGLYPPGSVFKVVVALAALEADLCRVDTVFFCDGTEEIGEVCVKCTAKEGHGELTMTEGFAKSCNSVFIQLGQLAGADRILEMAERLGFGREVLKGLNMDKTGNLPSEEDTAGPGIANLAIGQGSLLVTPLQVAQMTQIVANGGMDTGIWLADRLEFGERVRKLERQIPQRIMSEAVAGELLQMMSETVETGTASALKDWDCGGKTGSAEGYVDGIPATHAWFTGIVPAEEPQFTVTVFVEGGGYGSAAAVPLFERVMEVLE